MKTPRPCYSCGRDEHQSLLFPNRWHDFAVVCLGCGEFGAIMASADEAVDDWDARCERELRDESRAKLVEPA